MFWEAYYWTVNSQNAWLGGRDWPAAGSEKAKLQSQPAHGQGRKKASFPCILRVGHMFMFPLCVLLSGRMCLFVVCMALYLKVCAVLILDNNFEGKVKCNRIGS